MPSRTKSGKEKFKFITLDNVKLPNGKNGKKMIQIVGSESEMPTPQEMSEKMVKEGGDEDILESRVQPIVITRDYLMNKEFDMAIRIVPNSSVKESAADKKNKDIAFYQATAQNPLVDQEENLRDFAKAFDKSEDIIKKKGMDMQGAIDEKLGGLPGMPGMTGQQAPQQPAMDMGSLL